MNEADVDGSTALVLAAEGGQLDVVEALLASGADVYRFNNLGNTALHGAAGKTQNLVALALWRAGADPLQQNNAGQTLLSLLPTYSDAAEQMRNAASSLNELQQLWLHANSSSISAQQLLDAFNAAQVTSFSDVVLAHHLLLLAIRQRVLSRSQLAFFGGSLDFLLENVYVPVTNFSLTDEQKFLLFGMLSYAEKRKIVRGGSSMLDKTVFNLRPVTRRTGFTGLKMYLALVSVARQISSLHHRINALEQGKVDADKSFQHLCEGQPQMLTNMQHMAASLQELHGLLQKQQRNRTMAGMLNFCLSMIPVVGGALSASPFGVTEMAYVIE